MKRLRCIALLALVALAGCGPAREERIVIGSKNFTEQVVLGELMAQHIEARTGLPVERRFYLAGSYICHQAILAGRLDLYVEYTGTALSAILKQEPHGTSAEVLERVRHGYGEQFGLEVGEPLGFNNTFAMVIRGEDAQRLNLRTLSQSAAQAPRWRLGIGYEFLERPDGYKGLVATYGLRFAEPPRVMDLGLLYRALQERQVDMVAGSATDGVISALGMVVLEDDRHYFPPYDAVPIVRRETLARHSQVRAALAELAGRITEDDMRRLNYAVDGEHRDVKDVVREFRQAKGL
ncbi:MAG TPA: glycine betaine ABC transporter substrate-binding protein [Terriglobales bacterium]|nr:glycine betaine ABC transporter substrate-binding protein [Terriglobales bacterium]